MCGIVGVFATSEVTNELRPTVLDMSKKIRHRGPDWSGIFSDKNIVLAHERLAIVDPQSGRRHYSAKIKTLFLLLMVKSIITRS